MTGKSLRIGLPEDAFLIAEMVSAMLVELADYGGHALSQDEERDEYLLGLIRAQLDDSCYRYLLAESRQGELLGVVGGESRSSLPVFTSKTMLHISALYVSPAHRRSGIGRSLLQAILDWGCEVGCEEADLNVLARNLASALYESLGFEVFQRQLIRRL